MAGLSSKNATALTAPKPMSSPPKHRRRSPQLQNPHKRNFSLAFLTRSLLSLNNFLNCVYGFWVVVVRWWLWVCYGYLARFGWVFFLSCVLGCGGCGGCWLVATGSSWQLCLVLRWVLRLWLVDCGNWLVVVVVVGFDLVGWVMGGTVGTLCVCVCVCFFFFNIGVFLRLFYCIVCIILMCCIEK